MEQIYNFIDIKLLTVLMISIIVSTILWAFFYYSSTWFKTKIAEKANQGILNFLRMSFFRHVVSFFINGGFHFIVLLLTIMSIFVLFKLSNNINPEAKKIQMVFTRSSNTDESYSSSIEQINLKFIINSDSLYSKSGNRGRSGLSLHYYTDIEDSVDYGLVYLKWNNQDSCIFFRDSSLYAEIPRLNLFQSERNKAAIGIVPAKSDYTTGGYIYKTHDINIVNDSWAPSEDNPYYYYYLSFNFAEAKLFQEAFVKDYKINFEIQIGDIVKNETIILTKCDTVKVLEKDTIKVDTIKFAMPSQAMTNKNLKITYINPVPDAITNGRIIYNRKESIDKILYGEYITIQAEDIDVMKKRNQESLLWTVLLGMCVGFLLDVFIQQIRELRNINSRNPVRKRLNTMRKKINIRKKKTESK